MTETEISKPKNHRTRWGVIILLILMSAAAAYGYISRREMLIANYMKMLKSDFNSVSNEGIIKLASLCPDSAKGLVLLSQSTSEKRIVRKRALKALYISGDAKCNALVSNFAISTKDENLQWAALEVLGEKRDIETLPVLRQICKNSPFPSTRMKAIRIYRMYLLKDVGMELALLLEDEDIAVAMEALSVLEAMSGEDFGDFHDAMRPAVLKEKKQEVVKKARFWWEGYKEKNSKTILPENKK